MHRIWLRIQARDSSRPMLGVGSKAGPPQEPGAVNCGVNRFPGERPRTAHPSRGEAREGYVAAIRWPARFPGGGASRGGTVPSRRVAELPRRVAEGAALARSYHDAWRKLPVSSTAPTGHLMKHDDGTANISITCQVYPWRQACHRCKGEEVVAARRAPLSKIPRLRTKGQADRAAQRLKDVHMS